MADENIKKDESESLDSMITGLKNVLSNSESLNYSDIMNSMAVAYSAASKANDESNEEAAKELQGILKELNNLAKSKKESKVVSKKLENNKSEVKEKNKEEETPKEEKKIPKPVKTSDPDVPDESEATVKNAVSATENTKQEIYAEFEAALAKEEKLKSAKVEEEIKPVPARDPIPEIDMTPKEKEEEIIDEPVTIEPKEIPSPVVEEKYETPSEEPTKEDLIVDTPSTTEKIIVSSKEVDEHRELSEEEKKDQKLYQDIVDIFTPKPFEGDDDLDEETSVDESKKGTENKEEAPTVASKEELDAEKVAAVEKEYSTLPDDITLYGVKSISRKKVSDTLKALSKLNTSNVDIQKLEMFDLNTSDTNLRRDYLRTRNDLIAVPKQSSIALLMSGHYEIISAYGNYDLISVERTIYSDQTSFADRERALYESIYAHVNYVSYAKEKPDFETWAKNIMYPDAASLFYGVYDANSLGDNHYLFDCPYCGAEVSITCPNKDLLVGVPNDLTKDKLEKFITNKDIMKLDSTEIARWAKTTVVRKLLPETSIIVDFAVPTLYDYLVTITTLDRINNRDMDGKLNISVIDEFTDNESDIEDFNRIMAYLYVKDIGIPARVEGTNKFRYIKLTEKADIIEHINGLDAEGDYSELLRGEDVRNLIVKTATRYYLHNCKCESCKKYSQVCFYQSKTNLFFQDWRGAEQEDDIKSEDGIEVINMDDEFKSDIPLPLAMKIDGMIRLFDGDYTASEVLSMDIPSQRTMVKARLEALKKSQENYSQGIMDAYSRRYASSMSLGGGDYSSGPSLSQTSQKSEEPPEQEHKYIDRSNSRNVKDLFPGRS